MNAPNETFDYEAMERKHRRTRLILLTGLFLVVAILGGVFLSVACRYSATDFVLILEEKDSFTVADGFLFPQGDDSYCASYNLDSAELKKYPTESMDLTAYGTKATFTYFRYLPELTAEEGKGRILPASADLIPLSRANTESKFVYKAPDDKKYLINLTSATMQPLFETKDVSADEYGVCITEFSHNGGLFAAGKEAGKLLIYVRESDTSFAIKEVHHIDFSSRFVSFDYYFCSANHVQVLGTDKDGNLHCVLVDARDASVNDCPRPDGKTYTNEPIFNPYSRAFLCEDSREAQDRLTRATYINLTLGTETTHKFDFPVVSTPSAISTTGDYALFTKVNHEDRTQELILSRAGKKNRSLTALLYELGYGEHTVKDVTFLADPIVLVTLDGEDGSTSIILKICY